MANLSNINNKFIVTDEGHVSIGATTTTYPLTVESGGVGTVLRAGTSFVSIDSVGSAASPSLIFNGDSNTGIWRPASDTLGFSTAGVERFKIGTSNALLIGTSYQLKFTTDDGSTQLGKLFEDVGFTVEGKINNNLNLRSLANTTQEGIKFQNKTGGVLSTHMFIEKAGNITIGNGDTGLTFGKLVLRGDPYVITDSGQARSFIDCSSNINPGAGLYTGAISFGGASTGRAAISGVQSPSGSDGDRQGLAFFTHGSGTGSADAAEAMRIQSDGNVGIGTDSPNEKLVIGTTGGTQNIEISNSYIQSFNRSGSPGYQTLNFYASSYAFNVGNVGIGTTSPSSKLQVGDGTTNVNVKVFGSATSGIQIHTASGNIASLEQYFGDEGSLWLRKGATTKVLVRADGDSYFNGGNVGIGTTSPGRKLTVTGDASGDANNLLLSNENDTNGDSASIGFSMLSNNTYVKSGIFFERTTTQGRGSLHLAVNNEVNGNNVTKSDAKLTINNVGNVGIGTTSPTVNKLQVEGSTDGLGIAIKNTGTGGRTYGIQSTGGTSGYGQGKLAFVDEAVGARMVITGGTGAGEGSTMINYTNSNIETYGSGAYSGKLIVKAHTTTPNAAITCLNGNVGGDNPVFINFVNEFVANQYNYLARIAAAPENTWTGTASTRNASLNFYTNSAGTSAERMRITSGGSLLVGGQTSTVYTEKFSIENTTASQGMVINQTDNANANDKIIFQNTNGVVGYIRTTGSATSYVTSSDYRLKEDLQDFNGLDKVSKIPVYNFKWKTDESRSYGVMAHELQEVLPDAVSGEKDAEEMQGVDYSKIVPFLIKSIQELKAEIELLKSK